MQYKFIYLVSLISWCFVCFAFVSHAHTHNGNTQRHADTHSTHKQLYCYCSDRPLNSPKVLCISECNIYRTNQYFDRTLICFTRILKLVYHRRGHLLLALHVLADRLQLLGGSIAGHDVDRADLGALVRGHRVLTEQLYAHVADQDGCAGRQDAHNRIDVHLNDDPRTGASDAHGSDQNERLRPVVDCEAFLPVKSAKSTAID